MADRLNIVYRRLDELIFLPRNAKQHDVGALSSSIGEFGMIDPLGVNPGENGQVNHTFDGNGRLETLRSLKLSGEAPPRYVDVDADGMWLVPTVGGVVLSELDEERAALALNRTHDLGGYDEPELAKILQDLAAQDALGGTGYDGGDLDALLANLSSAGDFDFGNLPDADRAPFRQVTFTLHDSQFEQVESAIKASKAMGAFVNSLNENSNGNALTRICETFLTEHGDS